MPLYIAKDFDGDIESIVYAKERNLADAFWQGQKIFAHSVTKITEKEILSNHPTGVVPILTTKLKQVRYLDSDKSIRIICKD